MNIAGQSKSLPATALECIKSDDIASLRIICDLSGEQKFDLEVVDTYGNTALLKACFLGRYIAAEILLEAGANIKAINNFGQNALTLATHAGHLPLVRKLLRFRSYEDFNSSSLMPALCVAIYRKHNCLINFFRNLNGNKSPNSMEQLETTHGISPLELENMINGTEVVAKNYKHLRF